MFKRLNLLIGGLIILTLTGCPYKTKVPISKPEQKIEKRYLGKWEKISGYQKDNPEYFTFSKKSDIIYEVGHYTYNSQEKEYTKAEFEAHFTEIDNISFLNMRSLKENSYYLYKVEKVSDEEFILFEVTDNIDEKFNTSEELYSFIKQHMGLSFFYNKDEARYRKKE